MNNWANVGDLVFILDSNNEPVPCVVDKEIGTGMSTQLFFRVVDEVNDKHRIPKKRLKCFLKDCGYNGGFVFKTKQNALDYLDVVNKTGEKNFNINEMLKHKMTRMHKEAEENVANNYNKGINVATKTVISAVLLALNDVLGIGPSRGQKVLNKTNELIDMVNNGSMTRKDLIQEAEKKFGISIGGYEK